MNDDPKEKNTAPASVRRIGDYEILAEVGRGGMGVVYRARHALLGHDVALKVLASRLLSDQKAVARFVREMRTIGGLNHPNIVRALNAGEDRGTKFLATEFVDGATLQKLVVEKGPLPAGAACELIRQAATGLQYIHERGLVHRDIKPANLMLALDGTVKILDLGIARLRLADLKEDVSHSLTAVGTADYMAPEQWGGPDAVDIRTDIYGLGCTLLFLLSAQSPSMTLADFHSEDKETAIDAADQTGLFDGGEERLGCLRSILAQMLAEDMEERFDVPWEVVNALETLAEPRLLKRLLSTTENDDSSTRTLARQKSGQSGIRSENRGFSHIDSSPRTSDMPPTRIAMLSSTRVWKPIFAVLTLVICATIVWFSLDSANSDSPGSQRPVATDAVHALKMANDVAALPGLNGRWWFDETPWLMPFVRLAVADQLTLDISSETLVAPSTSHENPVLDPNTSRVQKWLLEESIRVQGQWEAAEQRLFQELLELSQQDLADSVLANHLRESLQRFRGAVDAGGRWTAAQIHARAVLEHKIAMIESDLELAELAAKSYESALASYSTAPTTTFALRPRCHIDYGQLLTTVFRDFSRARYHFREAREQPGTPLLLCAESLVDEGVASVVSNTDVANKYLEAATAFEHALDLLQGSEWGNVHHPLIGHAHERFAWTLMDQWSVREAIEHFKEARNIRFDNFWKSKNQFAQIFVFHNDHGQAMAERYCGDVKVARAQYDLIIAEVAKSLGLADAEPDRPGLQRFRRDLRERLSNSCERRADCELYQGAASETSVDLEEASRLYEVAREQADDPAVKLAMSYKRAIVLALDGRITEAEQTLQRESLQERGVIGVHEERVRLLAKLAKAVCSVRYRDSETGLNDLRVLLDEFDLSARQVDRYRRETLEIQLFAAEMLLSAEREGETKGDVSADVAYLERLLEGLPNREQMLVYLRRYYDLAIEAVAESHPERAAALMLASRGHTPPQEGTLLIFHFSDKSGRAVLCPKGRPSVCFTLGYGRRAVQDTSSAAGSAFSLPADLVDLITREQSTGQTVMVDWEDKNCWADENIAVAEEDWPFAEQLEFSSLQPPSVISP